MRRREKGEGMRGFYGCFTDVDLCLTCKGGLLNKHARCIAQSEYLIQSVEWYRRCLVVIACRRLPPSPTRLSPHLARPPAPHAAQSASSDQPERFQFNQHSRNGGRRVIAATRLCFAASRGCSATVQHVDCCRAAG